MVESRLSILHEHIQHLLAICQQISLNSGFRENGRPNARNPFIRYEFKKLAELIYIVCMYLMDNLSFDDIDLFNR